MKRFLVIAIVMLLCFGLAACGGVSQAEYDKLASENAALKAKIDDIEETPKQIESKVNSKEEMPSIFMDALNFDPNKIEIIYDEDVYAIRVYLLSSEKIYSDVNSNAKTDQTFNNHYARNLHFAELVDIKNSIIDYINENKLKDGYITYSLRDSNGNVHLVFGYDPIIGMTEAQVKTLTSWITPNHINRDTTKHGVSEQWAYDKKGYLYFDDGILTSIQER